MDLYEALCEDHHRLDRLFEALLEGMRVNDTDAIQATWAELDQGLAAHLDAEDRHMLPFLEPFDPDEAAAVRAEHARIRSMMAELGVMLDIHAVREERVIELVAFLRAHAAREERKLYPWATRELPKASWQSLLQQVGASRSGLVRA